MKPQGTLASDTVTADLLVRAKGGDTPATDRLFRRLIPRLARWMSGRLPRYARAHLDTADIVQDTVIRSLKPLQTFESRGPTALEAYLRQVATNRIRDEIRKTIRRPVRVELLEPHCLDSPLMAAIDAEDRSRYECCLRRLRPEDRRAIEGRLTEDLTYEELALRLRKPTAGAARVAVTRALMRLAREMNREEPQ